MSNLRKVELFDGDNTVDVIATNGSYGLVTIEPNHISTDNSTTDILGVGEEYTGTSEDITNYAVMFVNVYSDVASATDGLCIEFSTDNLHWDISECYTINADTYKTFSIQCATKYFRIKYTNGDTIQSEFRIQVKLCTKNALDSSHRIADSISDQDDATLNKSVLSAQQPNFSFVNIGATESGNLKVTDAENGLAIAKGDVTGSTFVHKFGQAPDFDYGDGEVSIWDGANDSSVNQMGYVFPTTASITHMSSSSSSDTQLLRIQGLDENWQLVTQEKQLQGQTKVALDTPLIRSFRARNIGSVDIVGRVFVYEDGTITNGVPDDSTKVKLEINNGNNQTLMAIYTIPDGYTGYLRDWYASTAGASKSSEYIIRLKARDNLNNGVFQLKHISSISDIGTSYIQHNYNEPERFTERTDIIMTCQTTAIGVSGCSVSAGFDIVLIEN